MPVAVHPVVILAGLRLDQIGKGRSQPKEFPAVAKPASV
jgi:hypothetical protein